MPAALRLVIFDCNGTLVDSLGAIAAAMSEAFTAAGLPPPPPMAVRQVVGLELVTAVAALAPALPPEQHVAVAETYKAAFGRNRREERFAEPLYPGARDALEALDAAGILLAVATGKSRRGLAAVLEKHGLEKYFISLQTPDTNPGKPHPGMVFSALAEAGVDAPRAVVVGDTTFDMAMAVNARVAGVGVAWGYHAPAMLEAAGAMTVARSFPELTRRLLAAPPSPPSPPSPSPPSPPSSPPTAEEAPPCP